MENLCHFSLGPEGSKKLISRVLLKDQNTVKKKKTGVPLSNQTKLGTEPECVVENLDLPTVTSQEQKNTQYQDKPFKAGYYTERILISSFRPPDPSDYCQ